MKKFNTKALIEASCNRIAPAWPLKNFVAVNPYSGFTDTDFAQTAKQLAERGDIRMAMPIQFYLDQIKNEIISENDIEKAFEKQGLYLESFDEFIHRAEYLAGTTNSSNSKGFTLTDIATQITGKNWTEFIVERLSSWSSSYFDTYVAIWNTSDVTQDLFMSWKGDAEIDMSAELMGLKGFRDVISKLPNDPYETIEFILAKIKLDEEEAEAYLHANLLKVIGWSSYISGLDYNAKLYSEENKYMHEFLAIILACEFYFFDAIGNEKIKELWFKRSYEATLEGRTFLESTETELILQDAYDCARQRELIEAFDNHMPIEIEEKVNAQMVFCIDVRSEVYRRNLESIDHNIETIGFAGFFGFPIDYVPLGHSQGKNQCPVLIPTAVTVKESFSNDSLANRKRKTSHQIEKTWKKFKSGAVSSFGYVSPLGLSFLPKLIFNSTGLTRPVKDPDQDGLKKWLKEERKLDMTSISLEQKVAMAAGSLNGMGIKDNLAPLVLITGHGSTSVNNPHASGLDCGACGGHSGEINAMTAAQIMNEPEVRVALVNENIHIPKDTLFVACLHDTTTDEVKIINEAFIPQSHKVALQNVKESLKKASGKNRLERSRRLNLDTENLEKINKKVLGRANDWSQIRPEWGLAGCNTFVVAPRSRTKGLDLQGKSFLQSYDAKTDIENKILESIMTAPMVVTSWINLQYYASAVDNLHFGSGNKTLHNVAGGIGVLEGSSGDLRIGLPLQSVHNGEKLEHSPQRLNVIIEASIDSINSVLEKNESIKQLCDNSWITLLKLDSDGKISHRYTKDCAWEQLEQNIDNIQKRELQTL